MNNVTSLWPSWCAGYRRRSLLQKMGRSRAGLSDHGNGTVLTPSGSSSIFARPRSEDRHAVTGALLRADLCPRRLCGGRMSRLCPLEGLDLKLSTNKDHTHPLVRVILLSTKPSEAH